MTVTIATTITIKAACLKVLSACFESKSISICCYSRLLNIVHN